MAIAGKDLYTNEAIAGIVPKDNRIIPKYLYYLLPRVDFSSYIQRAAKGKTLNKPRIESIRIPLPSSDIQKEIIREMEKKERLRIKLMEKIKDLETTQNRIMSEHQIKERQKKKAKQKMGAKENPIHGMDFHEIMARGVRVKKPKS